MIIYLIENVVNNKVYVGQTIRTLEQRWTAHVQSMKNGNGCPALMNAMLKYGVENFTIKQIDSASTKEELDKKETYWITKYNATNHRYGYNIAPGGGGGNTYKHLDEARMRDIKSLTDAYAKLGLKKPSKKFFRESDTCEYREYLFRKSNKCVSTIPDECKGVGPEMSTGPKR